MGLLLVLFCSLFYNFCEKYLVFPSFLKFLRIFGFRKIMKKLEMDGECISGALLLWIKLYYGGNYVWEEERGKIVIKKK